MEGTAMHDDQLTEAEAEVAHKWRLHQAAELLREADFVKTASGDWVQPTPPRTFKVVYAKREAPKV